MVILDSIRKVSRWRAGGWLLLALPFLLGTGDSETETTLRPGFYTGRYRVHVVGGEEEEFFVDLLQRGKSISGISYYGNGVFDISGSVGEEGNVLDIVFYFTVTTNFGQEARVLLLGHASDVTDQVNSFVGTIFTGKNASPFVAIRISDYDGGEDDPCEDGDPDCLFRTTRLPGKEL